MELIEEIKELKKYKEDNDLTIAELARKIERYTFTNRKSGSLK